MLHDGHPSLPTAIIERTRDVKDVIRREAFLRLSEKCSIRHLSIHQRIQLLSDGLNDRSGLVQEACVSGLLRSWSLSLDGDFLSLLSRLDVESSPEVCVCLTHLCVWLFPSSLQTGEFYFNCNTIIRVESHRPVRIFLLLFCTCR